MCNNNQSCNPQLHGNLLNFNEEVWKSDPNITVVDPSKNVLYTVKDGLTNICCGSMDEVYDRITNFKAYSTIKDLLENNDNTYFGMINSRGVLMFKNIKNIDKFENDNKDLFKIFEKICTIYKGEDNISFAFRKDAPCWLTTYISNISAEIKMRDPEYQTMLTDIIFNLNNSCNSAFPEFYK